MNVSPEQFLLLAAAAVPAAIIVDWLARYLWRCARRIAAWLKRKFRELREWLRKRWEPIAPVIRRIPHAVVYTIYVLALSIAAPGFYVAAAAFFAYKSWWPAYLDNPISAAVIALISGFTTALIVSALRGKRTKLAGQVIEELGAKTKRDGDAAPVGFEPARKRAWYESGEREYFGIKEAPRTVNEWMLVLRQISPSAKVPHTIDSLRAQLVAFVHEVDQINATREINHKSAEVERNDLLPVSERKMEPLAEAKKLKVRWVCYVSDSGRFHAYQRFDIFRFDIMIRSNSRYARLLNQRSEATFSAEIDTEIALSKDRESGQRAQTDPDVIRGLERFWLERGTTNEAALAVLAGNGRPHAMLVTDRGHGEPLGVVSATELAKRVVLTPAKSYGVRKYEFSPGDKDTLFGDGAPGLEKKNAGDAKPGPASQ